MEELLSFHFWICPTVSIFFHSSFLQVLQNFSIVIFHIFIYSQTLYSFYSCYKFELIFISFYLVLLFDFILKNILKIFFKPPQNHSGMQWSIHKNMFHFYWHQHEKILKCSVAVFYGLSHILAVIVLLDCLQIPVHSSKMKRLIFFFFRSWGGIGTYGENFNRGED